MTVPANCYVVIATSGVNAVEEINAAEIEEESIEYYNIQGIRISYPESGQIHIVKKGNKTYKAIAQ